MPNKPNPQQIPCGRNADGTECVMVTFEDSIQKIHGIYYQMDRMMCQACYNAVRRCNKGVLQTGPVVDRLAYKTWKDKIAELTKIQKKLENEKHLTDLKTGKIG